MIKAVMTEADWQAQDDAYNLIRAEEVRADDVRLKNALNWVEQLSEEAKDKTKIYSKLAKENNKLKT